MTGFIISILKGMNLKEAARFVNVVEALALTKKGPMEETPIIEKVNKLIESSIN